MISLVWSPWVVIHRGVCAVYLDFEYRGKQRNKVNIWRKAKKKKHITFLLDLRRSGRQEGIRECVEGERVCVCDLLPIFSNTKISSLNLGMRCGYKSEINGSISRENEGGSKGDSF